MDAQFVWQKEFNIGVDSIDKEHQRLFKIINRIFSFKDEEANRKWACQEGIKFFKEHALKHFADEEAYMISIGYEGFDQHRRIHRSFRENTLPALEGELEQADYSQEAVDHFLGVCAGWLIGHTTTEDLSITGKRLRKWENLPSNEVITAMKNGINQLVFDMFHLESRLISDAYGGERFGEGVYYDLIYGTGQDEKKQEIILVFEEKLLISTLGKHMGVRSDKFDSMLVHAARYTARQFVGRIMEQFPAMEAYELRGEKLLSYEQFQKVFEREKPQLSLLFNTGEGYFAYCIIAPHLLQNGVGTAIGAENAMTEVEQYLISRKGTGTRKKVLIVDDSMTIRKRIQDLLDKDYEVAQAESGVAAIRAITLSRPDLVLLDYEMPVCDGKQTLEMLRSEKEFTNIPVIFLTGRGDPESVRNVMALKPAGYLLKNLKPAEIKKNIDDFFEKKKG